MLFPLKSLFMFVLIALLVSLPIGFLTGYYHWNRDDVKCFQVKQYQNKDEWHTFIAIKKFEVRYHPVNLDCDNDWKFDPDKWEKDRLGEITPKLTE